MKLFVCLAGVCITTFFIYWFLSFITSGVKKKHQRRAHIITIILALMIGLLLIGFVFSCAFRVQRDTYCLTSHTPTTVKPAYTNTASDYFVLGNYEYERGNCTGAIDAYTKSIELNPRYAQAYNNRAYTYMRMQRYASALTDLDTAIELKPNYVQALMNRGDIRHYYWAIDKGCAIDDYLTVLMYQKTTDRTTCGHLFLARHNGWSIQTLLALPWEYITGTWCK